MASTSPTLVPPGGAFTSSRRDRPWLLSSNRKLRNVVAISIRNIVIGNTESRRHRGRTIDDEAVPNTLSSPSKINALREHRGLEHSHSSADLRSVGEDEHPGTQPTPDADQSQHSANGKPSTPPRPSIRRMRRRSTLEWANATPRKRQERLESLTAERMASVFFTCHVRDVKGPIYISETVPHTMNPTFRHVDFSACGPAVTRLDAMTVRVWVKSTNAQRWRQLLEMHVDLPDLQYLGKTLDQVQQTFPLNTAIFQLTDGFYTPYVSLTDYQPPPLGKGGFASTGRALATSSFDALLRLSKLDDSVQDAIATRNKIAADLESLLQSNKAALVQQDETAQADDQVKTIEYARSTVEKQVEKARKQVEEKRASLQARKRLMLDDLRQRQLETDHLHSAQPQLTGYRDELEIRRKAIQSQRRRICEDLLKCYPISPIPKRSLAFTIHDLHLPNSDDLDNELPEEVAAALGHVAHILLLLSVYLRHPLPYPVYPRGSTGVIEDPLSLLKIKASPSSRSDEATMRTYPLFSRGVPRFRFDYAVFLLNKNIQVLLESAYRVRVLDLRHTLPNLKYLLYVATAGAGELPARKAGGVRGLLRAHSGANRVGDSRPEVTRESSDSSVDSGPLDFHRRILMSANGSPTGAIESLKRNFAGSRRR